MTTSDAVTQWIDQLREGESEAADKLWQRYFEQIVQLARRKLQGAKRGVADEEDVAVSAFKSLCIGVREGRYPKLTDRNSLWSLLMAITAFKSTDLIRRENRQKRGGTGKPLGDQEDSKQPFQAIPLHEIIQKQPSLEFAAQMSEQFDMLLKKLEASSDSDLLQIALGKMMGHSTSEIADEIGCARRTVERKTLLIHRVWQDEIDRSIET